MTNPKMGNLKNVNFIGDNLAKANLKEANLTGANLIEANLRLANLQGANLLEGAKLKEANLKGADLEGARNLSFYQLSLVKTLHDTKLDEDLLIQLKEKHPTLFEVHNFHE
jgi:uncharacterized protein YjbI with pentapeptide repeats